MPNDQRRFDKIEKYLRGKLRPEEAAAFETEVANDPELAALVQQHRLERQGVELLVEQDLLAKMRRWELDAPPVDMEAAGLVRPRPQAPPSPPDGAAPKKEPWFPPFPALQVLYRRVPVAARLAAVLLTAVLGWWLLRDSATTTNVPTSPGPVAKTETPKTQPPATRPTQPTRPYTRKPGGTAAQPSREPARPGAEKPERPAVTPPTQRPPAQQPATAPPPDYAALANEYYRENDFIRPQTGGGGGGLANSLYDRALKDFSGGRYQDVVRKLRPAMEIGPNKLKAKELVAHSLYRNRQYDAAIPYFRQLAASGQAPYAERAEWALALTLLHRQPAKRTLLNQVLNDITADPGHEFYRQAAGLKQKLNRN
jgi:hypothetical protein